MKKKKNILDEFSLIQALTAAYLKPSLRQNPDVVLGPGDDAAWIRRPRRDLFLTTDMLVERVHFRRDWMSFEAIGFKAMRVNFSDIAAMGGQPRFALVSLALPTTATTEEVKSLYRGFSKACRPWDVAIIGGDMNRASQWIVNVTLIGEKTIQQQLSRSGARVGDDVYVTGHLGESALGLRLLRKGKRGGCFIRRHFEPPCRVLMGQKLARLAGVSSLMDISDGLEGDIEHILKASGVGAEIFRERLPLSKPYRLRCSQEKIDAYRLAMTGGEDYELLFTVSPRVRVPDKIDGVPLTKIGKITPSNPHAKKRPGRAFRHF